MKPISLKEVEECSKDLDKVVLIGFYANAVRSSEMLVAGKLIKFERIDTYLNILHTAKLYHAEVEKNKKLVEALKFYAQNHSHVDMDYLAYRDGEKVPLKMKRIDLTSSITAKTAWEVMKGEAFEIRLGRIAREALKLCGVTE